MSYVLLYRDYSIKKHEISFRLLSALRLLAIDGSHSRVALDQRYLDWRDTILGETDIISQDNERRVLIMLKSLCERVIESSNDEKTQLMVNTYTFTTITIIAISSQYLNPSFFNN